MKNPTDRYFAARPLDKIGESLAQRLADEQSGDTSRQRMFATAFAHYYGYDMGRGPSFEIVRGGAQGEMSKIRVTKARAVAKSYLSVLVGPKVNWRPQAASDSPGAEAATIVASSLLEWQWKKRQLEQVYRMLGEMALVFTESWVFAPWDTTIGPVIGLEGNKPVRAGDIRYYNLLPWDVVRSSEVKSATQSQWRYVRLLENKWDLAKNHPKTALGEPSRDLILSASRDDAMKLASPNWKEDSDLVPVWYFFHDPCPSLPMGREVMMVSGNCVLRDRPLRYGTEDEPAAPLVRLALDELFGTPYGYSSWLDTLGPQELMDGLETAIATNQLTLSTQLVAMEKGSDINPNALSGMQTIEYPKGGKPPVGVNLVNTPAEVFNHLKQKAIDQQGLLNLNDTFRGQPDTAQMNAQAFTVLATQAISQNSPAQQAAVSAIALLGSKTIQTMARYVSDERKVSITGKQSKYLYTEKVYSGGTLKCISDVFCDVGNPIEQTAAGRFTLAQMYQGSKQQNGEPIYAEQLQHVIDTGRLEPVTSAGRDEMMLIDAENEALASGEKVIAHPLENHMLHARENTRPILNPAGRRNKAVNDATMEHVHEHYVLHYGLPPAMDPTTGQPLQISAYETAMQDPQYFIRIRLLLGQVPPQDMVPPPMPGQESGAPPPEGAGVMTPQGAPALPPLPPGPPPPQAAEPIAQPQNGLPI